MPSAQERDAEGRTPQSARFFTSAAVVRVCILAPRSVNFSRLEPKLEPRRRWDVFLREGNTKKKQNNKQKNPKRPYFPEPQRRTPVAPRRPRIVRGLGTRSVDRRRVINELTCYRLLTCK